MSNNSTHIEDNSDISTEPELHASILQFLVNHGYMETVEAFKREARRHLDMIPSTHVQIQNTDINHQLSRLQIRRPEDLKDGDNQYYSSLTAEFNDLHYANILAAVIEPQTHILATSSIDKTVKISTMLSDNKNISQRTYRHHQAPVLSIDFHPLIPHLMLTTSMDGSSVLVDTSFEPDFGVDVDSSGVCQVFKDHQKYIIRGLFAPEDGKYIATASYDRTVAIYETHTSSNSLPVYTLLKKVGPFVGNVETICFINSRLLVVGVRDDNYLHYIHLPDLQQERINMNSTGDDWVSFSPLYLSVSCDGNQLLCTTDQESGRTILFKVGESTQLQNYYIQSTDNKFAIKRNAWHPSGLYFYASGGDDYSIQVIETKTGRVVNTLKGHKAMIRSLVMDPNIGLITAGYDQSIKVWTHPTMPLIR
ncbi:WD40-repeat-containing domain protein [Pilobolus umbonatus]|nr:WD40-repeat-containing domain protein [Pilobolus umbonatus]